MQVEVFWAVSPCSVAVGYHREDGGGKILRNVGMYYITPYGFTAQKT